MHGVTNTAHGHVWLQISLAGDMATWLVKHSQLHPAFRNTPVMYDMDMGGYEDPTTAGRSRTFEGLILQVSHLPLLVSCCLRCKCDITLACVDH